MFDIPFIKKEFPDVKIPPIHIDLRFLLKSLGITGPLKEIEKKMKGGVMRQFPAHWTRSDRDGGRKSYGGILSLPADY